MPIHDWSTVPAGVFHGFHHRWLGRLAEALTATLPPDYYAEAEQHTEERVADVLTLHARSPSSPPSTGGFGSTAAVLTSPITSATHRAARHRPKARPRPKHVVVRHVTGHRVVALLEVVSPGNKDRRRSVDQFAEKAEYAILNGVHVAVVDLFPPARSAPHGLPARVWRRFDRSPVTLPAGRPFSLGSFVAKGKPEAYFEFRGVGEGLPAFPLFLTDTRYIHLPLADTYDATFAASPPYLREQLSAPAPTGA